MQDSCDSAVLSEARGYSNGMSEHSTHQEQYTTVTQRSCSKEAHSGEKNQTPGK
jgi:ribosome modulation factor